MDLEFFLETQSICRHTKVEPADFLNAERYEEYRKIENPSSVMNHIGSFHTWCEELYKTVKGEFAYIIDYSPSFENSHVSPLCEIPYEKRDEVKEIVVWAIRKKIEVEYRSPICAAGIENVPTIAEQMQKIAKSKNERFDYAI